MSPVNQANPLVAIACGGTGGHLFPGLAVAGELKRSGCDVAVLVSPKEVDQQAVRSASGLEVFTLPAVGLQNRNYFSFARNFVKSLFAARKVFRRRRPQAVLAMGGFTGAPPILVGKDMGAKTFLHESNTIPGKANRYLARLVDEAFVGFPETAARLCARAVTCTGTPVRPQFQIFDAGRREAAARQLGLASGQPVVLITGGSQGASGLNAMVLSSLPMLASRNWQWLHLTGSADFEKVKSAYAALGIPAVVRPFLTEMELALGLASVAVSRAGASSLAEIAALRLPALLVPFPAAADNHQFFNARAFVSGGAARLLEQRESTPEKVAAVLTELVENGPVRSGMVEALGRWHTPDSAWQIAARITGCLPATAGRPAKDAREFPGHSLGPNKPSAARP
jgi:UDP-N-acetylglucosamine--N-acetylmuramyl-(pentapeptide) pyrophosphoryl-undecaprenol N-acetylglucosamine transferase